MCFFSVALWIEIGKFESYFESTERVDILLKLHILALLESLLQPPVEKLRFTHTCLLHTNMLLVLHAPQAALTHPGV